MTQHVNSVGGSYRVYGLTMTSDTVLPELPPLDPASHLPTLAVRLAARFPRVSAPTQWLRHWPLAPEEPWLSCGKVADGYLLRFRELADFFVDDAGQEIIGTAEPGTATDTLRHLLLDQVFPLVLNLRGQDALHATAVATPHGVCAFTGETGTGKSTLAASFAQAGYLVVSDDCLVIEERDGRLLAVPAYPGVRLWDDSRAALVSADEVLSPMAHYTDKHRIVWPAHASAFPTQALPLHRIYLLTRETGETSFTECVPRIDPCSLRQAFMALLEQTFRLDVTDSAMLVRQMHWLERLVSFVPVRRLVFPTALSALPAVREAILNDLAGCQ
ncbi:MAG: hypothetical protein HOP18_16350 [Deltaproteobacteria bacterium]|nr:hypothetical protein [Deltaproteobacteria bacterium]